MAKVVRPAPRRPAWLYPAGTVLELRDGRRFKVVWEEFSWYDEWGDYEGPGYQRAWEQLDTKG